METSLQCVRNIDDDNVQSAYPTSQIKIPGKLTSSYRSLDPLSIIGEETEWAKLGFRRVDYLHASEKLICLYRDGVEFILKESKGRCVIPNRELYGYGGDAYVIAEDQQSLQDEFEAKGVKVVQRLHKTDYHNQEFVIEDADGRWIYFGIKEG